MNAASRCVALVLLAAIAGRGQGLRLGETVRETGASFPGAEECGPDGDPLFWAIYIQDATTGRPIPGAVVQVPNHHMGGALPENIYQRCVAKADCDGWARIPTRHLCGRLDHIVADAPGFAPNIDIDPFLARCALVPGTDVPIVLLDMTGQPVANAEVGYNLGCGHIPDQRQATTDAKGRTVLRSILPSAIGALFVRHAQCLSITRDDGRSWRLGDPPVPVTVEPGTVVEGRALLEDGSPWAGACIGAVGSQRLWVRADGDGRFQLVGVAPWEHIDVYDPGDFEDPIASYRAPPSGTQWTIVRGQPLDGTDVTIFLRSPKGSPVLGCVAAVRSDGFTAVEEGDLVGEVNLSLPPGKYTLRVDGQLFACGSTEVPLEVTGSSPVELTVEMPLNPIVRVRAPGTWNGWVELATASRARALSAEEVAGGEIAVPQNERAVFRVTAMDPSGEYVVRIIPVPPDPGPATPVVVLSLPAITRVTARLVGPTGNPTDGVLRISRNLVSARFQPAQSDPAATVHAETRLTGVLEWTAEPVDESLDPVHGVLTITEAGAPIDLGTIRVPARSERPLCVLALPPELLGSHIVARSALPDRGWYSASTADAGSSLEIDLHERAGGEDVIVTAFARQGSPPWVPCRLRLDGPPPWRTRWPIGSLDLIIREPGGSPISDVAVFVDGEILHVQVGDSGTYQVLGIAEGDHKVVVASKRHFAKVFSLRFDHGEARRLEVVLRVRST